MGRPRIVVTGAGGLLGTELVTLLASTSDVVAISRRPATVEESAVQWISTDLEDENFVDALPSQADGVVHLAQSTRFRDFPEGVESVVRVNVASTVLLADWARRSGVRSFVLASSGGVYGGGAASLRESDRVADPGPLDFYLGTKLSSELLASPYREFMTVVVLRFFFVYGRRQRRSMLIPRLIERVRNGEEIELHGSEGIRLNPVHVGDAARATAKALDLTESQTVNVAGAEIVSLRDLAERIGREVNSRPLFTRSDHPPLDVVGDIDKMTELLVRPKVDLRQGMAEMCAPYG